MKKFYLLILLFLFNSIVSAQTATAPTGTGTQCNPYQIASLENLYWITQNSSVWTGARFFIQTQNIDASSTNTWASGAGWIPIGSAASRFNGHYNGQGFKITNLFMNRPSGDKAFFAWLQGATVKNLTIESPSFTLTSSGNWNAIFAARAGNVTIDNVKIVGGSLTASGSGISAPMFGEVYTLSGSTSTISNCSNTANASLKDYTAGFLGSSNTYGNAITISNCFSNATISGTWRVGGFAGHPSGTITFEKCYSAGSVSGADNVGGFIGVCDDAVQTFNDCYSTANVTATTWKGGGFFGWIWNWNSVMNINFNRCYATGSVTGGNPKGGFGGDDNGYTSNVFFSNCFWNNQTSGITTGVGTNSRTGLTGLTTANMRIQSSYSNAGWNFTSNWDIASGVNNGYPTLRYPTITNLNHPTCSPTITTSGTFTSFSSCQGTASSNQTLSVSGTNLTANISISAPTGFEISTNASSGFGSSLTLNQTGGSVASTTIFIRMTATATGSPSGNISLTSTGATTVNAAVSGNVSNPIITGTFDIYEDNTTQLSCTDAAAASTPWISLNTSLLTTSNTGLITGVYPGAGRVVYTTNAGCKDTVTVNVHETEWTGTHSNDFTLGSNWKLNSRPTIIKKIRFNNNAVNNLILSTRIIVDSIDFGTSNRQIELGDNDLIVNHIRNFNANRFIKTNGVGKVKKGITNNTSFTFPVGKSSYNPVTITNKTGTTDSFSVNIIDTAYLNGTTSGNINNPYVKRTWNISKNTPSANSSNGVDLSFTWNANEVVGTLTTPTLNHHNGSGWEIPTIGTSSVSGNTLTYTGYKGTFSPFAIGGSSTVALPVELKAFKAICQSDYIQIDWTTASEIRNKAFELYKSENAQDWNFIHTEAGQGDKATETQYSFKDLDKKIGYYRLKDIDEDGIENWSQIIFADCKNDVSRIQIYPNPASDFIKVIAPISENTILKILSLEGKVLKTIFLISNQTLVPVNDLASGVYIIDLNNVMQKIKFIKD